jgi:3-deoxy-D-manno-octulosonic-acid transferase
LHGPRTANFAADYAQLAAADGAVVVRSADDVTAALLDDSLGATVANAKGAVDLASTRTDKLAADMLQFLGTANAR